MRRVPDRLRASALERFCLLLGGGVFAAVAFGQVYFVAQLLSLP